jgi:catechol 2,3-dioxygenase-like lactoylglutathione lyase family enzyme
MKFGHIELFCENVEETADFYTNILDMELVALNSPHHMWVASGEVEILFRKGKPKSTETYQESSSALVVYTDDLDGTRSTLVEKGVEFLGFDGSENCLTFRDPAGHWLQLVNPNDH